MRWKEDQREHTKLCRLWSVFWNDRLVLCKSREVEIVQYACREFNTGGKGNNGVGGKKGYKYSSYSDFLVQLVRYDKLDSYHAFCWLMNTKRPRLYLSQPPGTWWIRSLATRFSTHSEESQPCQVLLLHLTALSPLRPLASRCTLRRPQVVLTVQPSNMATNTPCCGKSTHNWCHRIENTSLFALWCL